MTTCAVPVERHSLPRLVVIGAVLVTGLQVRQAENQLVMAALLALTLTAAVAVVVGPPRRWSTTRRWGDPGLAAVVVVGVSLVMCGAQLSGRVSAHPWPVLPVVAGYVALGLLACRTPRAGRPWFAAFLLVHAVLVLLAIHQAAPTIDVELYLRHGVEALLGGRDPYGGSVSNPYSPRMTESYLAPQLVEGSRILVGFPYLPGVLLAEIPGHLAGDPRLGHLAALLGLAVLLRRLATDGAGRALSLLVVASPLSTALVTGFHVEPVVMLALGAVVASMRSGARRWGAASVALLLVSKQYVVVMLPLLLLVGRRLGARVVLASVGIAAALTLAFVAWDPQGFWRDVVTCQLVQPYREDSISLLVAAGNEWGRPPGWVSAVLPIVGGLLVSTLVAVRSRPGPTATALCVGLSLFATVLLSKQAFANYFALIQAALVMASITWPRDDPDPTIDRSH